MRFELASLALATLTLSWSLPAASAQPAAQAAQRVSLGVRVKAAPQGLEVLALKPQGPAARAGVLTGDVLVAIGGEPLSDLDDLGQALGKLRPGQRVQLGVLRNRRVLRLSLKFERTRGVQSPGSLGAQLVERGQGLEVLALRPGGLAAGRLRVGDVIQRWGGERLRSFADLERAMSRVRGRKASRVRVLRQGKQVSVQLPALAGERQARRARPRAEVKGAPFGLRAEERQGVVHVLEVAPGSTAAAAGILPGDRVVSVGPKAVSSLDALGQALRRVRAGRRAFVSLRRGQNTRAALPFESGSSRRLGRSASQGGQLGVTLSSRGPGVRVAAVRVGSPAQALGLRSGDLIEELNGKGVNTPARFKELLRQGGDEVELTIRRGQARPMQAKTRLLSPRARRLGSKARARGPKGKPRLGAALKDSAQGVVVTELAPKGPMERAGLLPGDLVISFKGFKVTSVEDFARRFASCRPGQIVKVVIRRQGSSKTLRVTLGG